MPDSSQIETALVGKLSADAALTALMPDGVHFGFGPSGKKRFVHVSLIIAPDGQMQGARAFEQPEYLVKAVEQHVSGIGVTAAAARIDVLLDQQPLVVTGYKHSITRRTERVRYTEVDDANKDIHWQHGGGRYELFVSTP